MSRHSILVVDDELLIRDLLYDYFQEQSWDITVAESGPTALKRLSEGEYDVLLTDLRMPEMDGSTLIDEVRERYPEMPVVIMTGYPSVETAVKALRQRVDDYLTKPFNVTKLYKAVEEALGRRQQGSPPGS